MYIGAVEFKIKEIERKGGGDNRKNYLEAQKMIV